MRQTALRVKAEAAASEARKKTAKKKTALRRSETGGQRSASYGRTMRARAK